MPDRWWCIAASCVRERGPVQAGLCRGHVREGDDGEHGDRGFLVPLEDERGDGFVDLALASSKIDE